MRCIAWTSASDSRGSGGTGVMREMLKAEVMGSRNEAANKVSISNLSHHPRPHTLTTHPTLLSCYEIVHHSFSIIPSINSSITLFLVPPHPHPHPMHPIHSKHFIHSYTQNTQYTLYTL